jgi:hypothetical protein
MTGIACLAVVGIAGYSPVMPIRLSFGVLMTVNATEHFEICRIGMTGGT